MLSYQHGYHAGNFADVIKHLTLCLVLDYLTQKEKPLFYLETHAGRGMYHLKSAQSLKTGEYQQGIARLWKARQTFSEEITCWLKRIEAFNKATLQYYPGSPALAIAALRPIDRLYLCELHPQEFEALQSLSTEGKRVHFSHSDGVAGLRSLLPPQEKRGLIMIDPSYEIKDDYKTIPEALHQAYLRFPTGVYILWYPVIHPVLTERLHARIKKIPAGKTLNLEFNLNAGQPSGMTRTGLWILNPPYILEQQLHAAMKVLCHYFNPGKSTYSLDCSSSDR